ncbi:hypothetical protein AB0N09_34595 [Streptomyces erythrochromogenes]|uniref:hypothetical protein n=1 Tax=Streptomyces erythrochromogenes TaxID=285574 RepID=UPI00343D1F78
MEPSSSSAPYGTPDSLSGAPGEENAQHLPFDANTAPDGFFITRDSLHPELWNLVVQNLSEADAASLHAVNRQFRWDATPGTVRVGTQDALNEALEADDVSRIIVECHDLEVGFFGNGAAIMIEGKRCTVSGNASVYALDGSHITVRDTACVNVTGTGYVDASGAAKVQAFDEASAPHIKARDDVHVWAIGKAKVAAAGSTTVVTDGNTVCVWATDTVNLEDAPTPCLITDTDPTESEWHELYALWRTQQPEELRGLLD